MVNEKERLDELRPRFTPEFLETLTEAIKNYGWTGDLIEVERFGEWVYDLAGVTITNDTHRPYED